MSQRTPTEIANDWIAAYNEQDIERLMRHTAADVTVQVAGGMIAHEGIDAWREHNTNEWRGFPDADFEVARVFEAGPIGVVEGVWHATLKGELALPDGNTMPPNGKHTDLPFILLFDIEEGKVKRITGYWNSMIAMQQLGLLG